MEYSKVPRKDEIKGTKTFSFLKRATSRRFLHDNRAVGEVSQGNINKEEKINKMEERIRTRFLPDENLPEKVAQKLNEVTDHRTRCYLNNCNIDCIPIQLFQQEWSSTLQLLDLSNNQFTLIPDLSKLISLVYLNLSNNKITSIPNEISNFSKLKVTLSVFYCLLFIKNIIKKIQ